MSAVQIGPLILSTPRFTAIVGLIALVAAAGLLERRRPGVTDWAFTSALLVAAGARLGFVLENLGAYLREPLAILYFWQGGFSPLWGLAAAAGYTVLRADIRRQAFPVAVVGLVAWGGALLLLTPVDRADVRRPDVPLLTMDGRRTDLDAVAAGRPVVLNLWAPWCLPCRRETPMLVDVAAGHPDTAFVLADQASSAADVRAFLEARSLGLGDVYLDTAARLGRELGTAGLPTTLFFAADGHLLHTHVGEISRAELERRTGALQEQAGVQAD